MGMGIVSDAEFEKELTRIAPETRPDNNSEVVIPEVLPMEHPGRKEGDNNVPDSLRRIIGETSEIEGRSAALELAATFGVSPSSVSAYSNGATSTATMDQTPNRKHINSAKLRIAKIAKKKLFATLGQITDEKLKDAKVEVLASVARNMSAIVKEMEPEAEKDDGRPQPQFIVYSPQIRDERHYEVTFARE